MSARRVLVLRPGALGDAVLTLPVLESLAVTGASVTAIGHPVFRLAAECGLAAEFIAFDDTRILGLFTEGGRCELFAGFDLAIVYGPRSDPLLHANLKGSGVAGVVSWPASPPPGMHIVDHLLGALERAEVPKATRIPNLPPRQGWCDEAKAWLAAHGIRGDFAAVHHGSGGKAKRWPLEQFAELARALPCPVVWLLGPAEAEDAEAHDLGRKLGIVAENLPLATLAGLLANCRLYVGNDSGVTHLAAAVGAPTLAIFGPTDPTVWGPRGRGPLSVIGGPEPGGFTWHSAGTVARSARLLLALAQAQ